MRESQIRVFPNPGILARAAAERFTELACQHAEQEGLFAAALSGGRTPRTFLEVLASPEFSDRVPWRQTHIFQVDERCVPPNHPDSNYRMIHEALLESVPQAASHFHRMSAEQEDRRAASEAYAKDLENALGPAAGNFPRFDLIFLGLGPDGHTASLFPGSKALAERTQWVCSNYVEKLQTHRLTLTFPVLNAAAEIVFLVSGPEKAEILQQVIQGPLQPEHLPAQQVHPSSGRVVWYIDEPASRLVAGAARYAS